MDLERLAAIATERKTCQVCFRLMVARDLVIVKHGWRESGQRLRGLYDRAQHQGECPGSRYQPFEVDCERTHWYFDVLKKEQATNEQGLRDAKSLDKRPKKLPSVSTVHLDHVTDWVDDDGRELEFPIDPYRSRSNYLKALVRHIRRLGANDKALVVQIKEVHDRLIAWRRVE